MSNLTIDQILNEIRGEVDTEAEVFSNEKTASAPNSSFSETEIGEMAELLKTASVSATSVEETEIEKIAEAIALSAAFDTIAESSKYDAFRKEAMAQGHSVKDVDAMIEKQAKASFLKNLNKKQVLMGLGIGTIASSAGVAGGYHVGTEKQKEKTKEVGQAAFRAGRLFQHARNRTRMSNFVNRFRSRMQQKGQQ